MSLLRRQHLIKNLQRINESFSRQIEVLEATIPENSNGAGRVAGLALGHLKFNADWLSNELAALLEELTPKVKEPADDTE